MSRAIRIRHDILLVFLFAAVGCGGGTISPDVRVSAQASYDAALKSMEAKDYAKAAEEFALARAGELPVELYVQSGFEHARCLTELGSFEDALAAIDTVRDGADEEAVHIARAEVFVAQEDVASAKAEYAEAKKHNPKLKIPANLR